MLDKLMYWFFNNDWKWTGRLVVFSNSITIIYALMEGYGVDPLSDVDGSSSIEDKIFSIYMSLLLLIALGVFAYVCNFLIMSIGILCFLVYFGVYDANNMQLIISAKENITIVEWIGFIIASVGLFLLMLRTGNQSRQINDEMFNSAVTLLGSNETSARIGGIYSLYFLAFNNKKYRVQVTQILCSHIRSKTREEKYQEEHKESPSKEIQTTINLLFQGNPTEKGLYYKFIPDLPILPKADLSSAYLAGADFWGTDLSSAYLAGADFSGAEFSGANCEKANFTKANCEEADFRGAINLKSTNFTDADCETAKFDEVPASANKHSANQQ